MKPDLSTIDNIDQLTDAFFKDLSRLAQLSVDKPFNCMSEVNSYFERASDIGFCNALKVDAFDLDKLIEDN